MSLADRSLKDNIFLLINGIYMCLSHRTSSISMNTSIEALHAKRHENKETM